eukprot:m.8238 g.8238  ORF g.8238 m.8238 type:complete len:307 (+) comp5193_c0_seq1:78-998(+)
MLRAILPRSGRVALSVHTPLRVTVYDGPAATAPSLSEVLISADSMPGADLEGLISLRREDDTLVIATADDVLPSLALTVYVPPTCNLKVEQPSHLASPAGVTLSQLYGDISVAGQGTVTLDRMHPTRLAVRCDGDIRGGSMEGPVDLASLAGTVRLRKLQTDRAHITSTKEVVLRSLYGRSHINGHDVAIGAAHGTTDVTALGNLFVGSATGSLFARVDGQAYVWASPPCGGSVSCSGPLEIAFASGSGQTFSLMNQTSPSPDPRQRGTLRDVQQSELELRGETLVSTPLSWIEAAARTAQKLGPA